MNFTIRQGLDIPLVGAPRQVIENGPDISSVALSTRDFHGTRPEVLVKLGERVVTGQPLFRDRNRAKILFSAPASGVVSEINYSLHRKLDSIVVACEEAPDASFDTSGDLRTALLKSGLWTSFKTRPFGHIPNPDAHVEAMTAVKLKRLLGKQFTLR